MRGNDTFDVEALSKKTAFSNTGCACTGGNGQYLREGGVFRMQEPVRQRCKERTDAIGGNDAARCRIPLSKSVADVQLMSLHLLDRLGTEFAPPFPVVGERAFAGAQAPVVMELLEINSPGSVRPSPPSKCSGRAVSLVSDGQSEFRGAVARLSLDDSSQTMTLPRE